MQIAKILAILHESSQQTKQAIMSISLQTPRLIIRPYTADDLDSRVRISVECFGNNANPAAMQSWIDWTVLSNRWFSGLSQPPYGDYVIALHDGTAIGSVGLVPSTIPWGVFEPVPPSDPDPLISPEFGLYWAILPEHQRKGYAAEAARAMIDFIFNTMHARRVVATTEFDNPASMGVMQKLGMTVLRNPTGKPFWCEVVGVLDNQPK